VYFTDSESSPMVAFGISGVQYY